jgi:phenylacetic acid degradation operon negative regulatory protein
MLEVLGEVAIHGAWSYLNQHSYPSTKALDQAIGRLSKQGLLVKRQGLHTPVLRLADDGDRVLPDFFQPEKFWNRKWGGIWYLLMYDIPEKDRGYRNTLRQFLKQQRMGCFQKSVWIASHDIRPQYADLNKAAALGAFACLFEAKTVLGMSLQQVVWESWDFDRLYEIQNRFCKVYEENLHSLEGTVAPSMNDLMQLAAQEIDAFRSAFVLDPLLPRQLLPLDYRGMETLALHRMIADRIRNKLMEVNPD